MKIFFPTGGRSNLATYSSVMSLIPLSEAGSRPIRQNFLPTVTPALQGREAETITPSARPEARRSLSAIRPPWLVITSRTIGNGQTLPDAGGSRSRSCRRASRREFALKNNFRPLRRGDRAARPPLRLARDSPFHAWRCSSVRPFQAADSVPLSSRARRWSGVGVFLRAPGLRLLPAIAAPPGERLVALAVLRVLMCVHRVMAF